MADVQIVIPAPAFSAGVSTLGNSSGNTGVTGTRLVFSGGDNVSLSQVTDASGGTIRIDAAPGPLSAFWPYNWGGTGTGQLGSTRPAIFPWLMPLPVSANTIRFWASCAMTTAANTSTASGDLSVKFALYTRNAATLSLLISGSSRFTWSNTSNANVNSISGLRAFDISLSHTSILPPGNYWGAWIFDSGNQGAQTVGYSSVLITNAAGLASGRFFAASSASGPNNFLPGMGRYSAGSTGFPSAIAFSEISIDQSNQRSQIFCALIGDTAYTTP